MKKRISGLCAFLSLCSLYAQNPLPRVKMPADYVLYDVAAGSEAIPSNKYQGYTFAYHTGDGSWVWYGQTSPTDIILLQKMPAGQFAFSQKNFTRCLYENKKVLICSSVPGKAEEVCGVFSWENYRLSFEKEQRSDPNPPLVKQADSLLKAGDPVKAAAIYEKVTFAKSYMDPEKKSVELFMAAFEKAKPLAAQNRFKNALEIVRPVMAFADSRLFEPITNTEAFRAKFGKKFHGLSPEECVADLLLYLEWMLKNREADAFLKEHGKYMLLSSEEPEFYRLRGDAYYTKRDKPKYVENYNTYRDKMIKAKREKEIPSYVLPRLK